jgi:DNA mismatch repair protein MutS2
MMHFEPRDVFRKLEFDKVLELLEKEALTPMGAELLANLAPDTSFTRIDLALREVRDWKLALEKNDRLPFATFYDVRDDLRMLEVDGYTLQSESFQRVLQILLVMRDLFKFFGQTVKREIYPKVYDIMRPLTYDEGLSKAIMAIFDEKGDIRPDASPELQRIRREMVNKARELDQKFRQIVSDFRAKGWLAETGESIRNGRRVLAVPAEHKRKIRGIIHDESDTGRTVYIEPDLVIEINNDIFDLEHDEKREIFKILKGLSDQIRPYSPVIAQYYHVLVRFDVIQAKAKLAISMRANMPILKEKPVFNVRKAYHPLLFLKNKGLGRKTVPFELKLHQEYYILILSGPNAGGKSVAMKSVGLLTLMVQSGLLVPCSEVSEFGIFRQIFADIGDQQSLEDDLSTYSSRLINAKVFLEKADPQTLVLIDEMGSGTDPKPGGAIAEAILRQLHRKGVFAVITTHYSNLKVFAFRNPGILNANMHFDKDNLSPTYELKVGRPGSSYAFEIATKSGLHRDLIEYARKRTGSETAVDDILIELQREKQELEEKLRSVTEKEQNLQRLINTNDSMYQELELGRKRLKMEQKEFELRQSANAAREVDKLIKELKDTKSLEKAQQVSNQLKSERAEKARQVDAINEQVIQLEEQNTPSASSRPLQAGDAVRLRSGGATGRIEQISGNKATVSMGQINVVAHIRDLVPVIEAESSRNTPLQADIRQVAAFDGKIDLRGLSREEALAQLEKFVDNALLSNANTLRILHGKGDGVLRKAVKQKLREYGGNVANIHHPEQEHGGDGVTIVDLV